MTIIFYRTIIIFLSLVVPLLISIAFYTLAERKLLSSFQRRIGPNVVGFFGILQPFADGLKLLTKEIIFPKNSNKFLFIFAPTFMLILSFINWSFIPFLSWTTFLDFNLSLLYIFALTSLSIYGLILGAWSSNSRYAFLGALRSSAQMISYEISFGIIIIIIVLCANSFNLIDIMNAQNVFYGNSSQINDIYMFFSEHFIYYDPFYKSENINLFFFFNNEIWFLIPLLPIFYIFYISILAETNRAPFDLPEAEAELVAGYNVEYSGILFAFYFLAEYSSMLLMSFLISCLFLGGISSFFFFFLFVDFKINFFYYFHDFSSHFILKLFKNSYNISYILKILFFAFSFVWVRATFPRYRYNQLMDLGWKIFLPFTLSFFIFIVGFFFFYKFYYLNNFNNYDYFINFDTNYIFFKKYINTSYLQYSEINLHLNKKLILFDFSKKYREFF